MLPNILAIVDAWNTIMAQHFGAAPCLSLLGWLVIISK